MNAASARYAADYLRTADRDRYFATLMLRGSARLALTALYAFNADVASLPNKVHDPVAGEIRLRWWIDALTGEGHGEVRQNPLADALLDATTAFHLPRAPLVALLEARRFDLYNDVMPDMPSFEGYAGETASTLYQLAATILGGRMLTGEAAGHLGVAHALVGHLRAFGFNAARGHIFLPWSVFSACGVEESEVLSGVVSEGLLSALQLIVEQAQEHLDKAAAAIAALPRPVRPAFAPLPALRRQLALVRTETVFQPQPDLSDLRTLATMIWWTWFG
jgi:phytoene synthase